MSVADDTVAAVFVVLLWPGYYPSTELNKIYALLVIISLKIDCVGQ